MQQGSEYIKGYEVLTLEHAELTKTENGTTSFITVGTLSVLYFQEYRRFILWLNDTWDFALVKRNHITSSSRTDMKTRSYTFPSFDGLYTVKLTKISHPEALQNFETILKYSSRLRYQGEEESIYEGDSSSISSLDDLDNFSDVSMTQEETLSNKLKGGDRIKRKLARFSDKIHGVFSRENKNNLNLTQVRDIKSIQNIDEGMLSAYEFARKDVRFAIMSIKHAPEELSSHSKDLTTLSQELERERMTKRTGVNTTITTTTTTLTTNVTESEFVVLNELETQRQIQEESRRVQEEQSRQQAELLEKERQLYELLRRKQEEKMTIEARKTEETLRSVVNYKEASLEELKERMQLERQLFEQTEDMLKSEIGVRASELELRERLAEQEHHRFEQREEQLIRINNSKEEERQELLQMQNELLEETRAQEVQLIEKEKLAQAQRREATELEEQLRAETEQKLNELKENQRLVEVERQKLQQREEELIRATQLKETERLNLENDQKEFRILTERRLAELNDKEMLTETQKQELYAREAEFVNEIERRLNELREKEKLTEDEAAELQAKEIRLSQVAECAVAERAQLESMEEEFAKTVSQREAELIEKERLIEMQRQELEKVRAQQQSTVELTGQTREIMQTLQIKLFEMIGQKATELKERETLTEAQHRELERREHELEMEVERRLAEVREKEKLTFEERAEIERREAMLIKVAQIGDGEDRKMREMLEKLKIHEALLMEKNKQLLTSHIELQNEIKIVQEDVSKTIQVEVFDQVLVNESKTAVGGRSVERESGMTNGTFETTTTG